MRSWENRVVLITRWVTIIEIDFLPSRTWLSSCYLDTAPGPVWSGYRCLSTTDQEVCESLPVSVTKLPREKLQEGMVCVGSEFWKFRAYSCLAYLFLGLWWAHGRNRRGRYVLWAGFDVPFPQKRLKGDPSPINSQQEASSLPHMGLWDI